MSGCCATWGSRGTRPNRKPLYRISQARHGPWFFSSDGTGRFDLPPPDGTCYLAGSPVSAFIEVFRDTKPVAQGDFQAGWLATLQVPVVARLADCTRRAARACGITTAAHATADYAATHRWAHAFHRAGCGGVRYLLSHDPGQRCVGIALFSATGPAAHPVHVDEPIGSDMITAAREFGILVLPTRSCHDVRGPITGVSTVRDEASGPP